MPSSEKKKSSIAKKIIGIVLKVAISVLIVALVITGINYAVLPANAYTRIQFHDLYDKYGANGENMDLVFIGTSHAYRCFDPQIFDEKLGVNSYNFGTSMQTISTSYYLLKEILKTNTPKQVVFELTYTCFNDKDHRPLKSVIASQYMRFSANKIDFIAHEFDLENIFYALLPAYCYRENLNPETLSKTLKAKTTAAYKDYDLSITKSKTEWMENKGYVYTDRSLSVYHVGQMDPEPWEADEMSEKYLNYFYKIIDLCREKNIKLTIVTSPVPRASLLELGNYGEICEYFDKVAADNDITYYNLNLLRKEKLDLVSTDFYDSHHVNGASSKKVSEIIAEMMLKEENGTFNHNEYFYSSWDEAKSTIDYITNAYMTVEEDEDNYYLTGHAHSGDDDAQYEYGFYLYNGSTAQNVTLRDWSTDSVYKMPKNLTEDGSSWRIEVAARFVGSNTQLVLCQRQILKFPREAS